MVKTILLNTAYWAMKQFVNKYVAGGLFERIEQLFNDLVDPEYAGESGETKRHRVVSAVEREYLEVRSVAGAVARGVIELLWLRQKVV